MFTTSFFSNAVSLKKPKFPLRGQGINKGWCIITMGKKRVKYYYTHNLDVSQINYAEWRKTDSKDYILYNCIYITLHKRKNYMVENR